MLAIGQPGYEALVAAELRTRDPAELKAACEGRNGGGAALLLEPAFPQRILFDEVELRGGSVNALAAALAESFAESLRGERIESEWPLLWHCPAETPGLSRRMAAVTDAFDALLRKR